MDLSACDNITKNPICHAESQIHCLFVPKRLQASGLLARCVQGKSDGMAHFGVLHIQRQDLRRVMEVIKFQAQGKAYTVHVGEDLFGSRYVLRRWFSLTSKRGGSKMHHNVTQDEVERLIGMVVARRKAHGYRIIEDGRDTRMEVPSNVLAQRAKMAVRNLDPSDFANDDEEADGGRATGSHGLPAWRL
jgi:hypothetical protein